MYFNACDEQTVNIKIKFYLTFLTCAGHAGVKKKNLKLVRRI